MSDANTEPETVDVTPETRIMGRVKWFNMKSGYGFITISPNQTDPVSDIFVHHSCISVAQEQYKYLVQGEYVEFSYIKTTDPSKHPVQAGKVSGIKSGKLMCETRYETRQTPSVGVGGVGGVGGGGRSVTAYPPLPPQQHHPPPPAFHGQPYAQPQQTCTFVPGGMNPVFYSYDPIRQQYVMSPYPQRGGGGGVCPVVGSRGNNHHRSGPRSWGPPPPPAATPLPSP